MTRRAFALSLAAGGVLAAETSRDRAKRVIDRTIEALGGEAFRNMSTRTEIGKAFTFYRDKLTAMYPARIYTKYLERDGKSPLYEMQRQALGKDQADTILFTTNEAYEVTFRGARPLPADQVKQFRENTLQNIFYILRERLGEPGIDFDSGGIDVVENQPVEIVDVYDAEDRKIRVWINSDSFLPARQRYYSWDPLINDRHEEVTHFTKYRKVGAIMWPFEVARDRDDEKYSQLLSEQVTADDPLPDSMFQLPNGIKMLPR